MKSQARFARGVTLIELVVTITIISIAVTAVVGSLMSHGVQSANRMIQQQARAIASSYLEQIVQTPFAGLDAYNGRNDVGALDQQGSAVAGLSPYTVSVQVIQGALTGIPPASTRLINVTVSHSNGVTVVTSGYRTNY